MDPSVLFRPDAAPSPSGKQRRWVQVDEKATTPAYLRDLPRLKRTLPRTGAPTGPPPSTDLVVAAEALSAPRSRCTKVPVHVEESADAVVVTIGVPQTSDARPCPSHEVTTALVPIDLERPVNGRNVTVR